MKKARICIVGKPNVGKSTLLNSIFQKKLAITSSKPQTTRNQLTFRFQRDDYDFIFFDTPGYHEPKNKLDKFLNYQTRLTFKNHDICLFLFDPTRDWDSEDDLMIEEFRKYKMTKVALILTKSDVVSKPDLENIKKGVVEKFEFIEVLEVSSFENTNIENLLEMVSKYSDLDLDNNDVLESSEDNDLVVSETIRNVIIDLFYHEIPYSVAVVVEKKEYSEKDKKFTINVSIVVEKESQKPILIGKGGHSIKQIGIESRKILEKIYDAQVVLLTNVKTKKDWRDDETFLKSIGYK